MQTSRNFPTQFLVVTLLLASVANSKTPPNDLTRSSLLKVLNNKATVLTSCYDSGFLLLMSLFSYFINTKGISVNGYTSKKLVQISNKATSNKNHSDMSELVVVLFPKQKIDPSLSYIKLRLGLITFIG